MPSASGGFAPDPHRGSAPGPRWGTSVPRPPGCPPCKKSCGRPWSAVVIGDWFTVYTRVTRTDRRMPWV